MKVTDPISSPSQHVVQTKNPRMENLRNQKWETSYKKATSTCHFIIRQIRSHSLCFPRHECRIWVLWDWVACFPCPRCIFIRRNFRTGNFNTNRSIITGDVKYGIKIPNVSCFLFIILASDSPKNNGSVQLFFWRNNFFSRVLLQRIHQFSVKKYSQRRRLFLVKLASWWYFLHTCTYVDNLTNVDKNHKTVPICAHGGTPTYDRNGANKTTGGVQLFSTTKQQFSHSTTYLFGKCRAVHMAALPHLT